MSEYRPIDQLDYKVNDTLIGEDEPPQNRLLDEDGRPNPEIRSKSLQGLAVIAAALHEHAPDMNPEHLEKAVWWVKDWRMHLLRRYRSETRSFEFHQVMEAQKNTSEFLHEGNRARWYSYGSQVVAALFGIAAATAVWAFVGDQGWGMRTGLTVLALFLASLTAGFRDTARDIWRIQDRKYFLKCLRLARDTEDLSRAGFFAYHPRTLVVNSAEEQLAFKKTVREMQLQFGDALYCDFDFYIRERFNERDEAYRLNWPSKKPV